MITIEVIQIYIKTNILPIKDGEIVLLNDIVRDLKTSLISGEYPDYNSSRKNRGYAKEFDSVSIMELLDYQVEIDPKRLENLNDKKRLCIKGNKTKNYIKNQFK